MCGFKKKYKYFFIGFFLLYPCVIYGVPALNLSKLVNEALQNNPEIKTTFARWCAVNATISQAKSLPDPTIDFGYKKQ